MEAEVIPLPKLEITPPVTKMYLVIYRDGALSADGSAFKTPLFD